MKRDDKEQDITADQSAGNASLTNLLTL